jgi:hypothetical protein
VGKVGAAVPEVGEGGPKAGIVVNTPSVGDAPAGVRDVAEVVDAAVAGAVEVAVGPAVDVGAAVEVAIPVAVAPAVPAGARVPVALAALPATVATAVGAGGGGERGAPGRGLKVRRPPRETVAARAATPSRTPTAVATESCVGSAPPEEGAVKVVQTMRWRRSGWTTSRKASPPP